MTRPRSALTRDKTRAIAGLRAHLAGILGKRFQRVFIVGTLVATSMQARA